MSLHTEVYRTANLLIDTFGPMAGVGAAIRADEYRKAGDIQSYDMWIQVARAADEILSEFVPEDANIH